MANIINQADAERVLRIIESLVEHVPEHIKLELDSLRGLLKSPLFYQYLDYHDLQKISELTDSGRDIEEFCQTVQNLKLSELDMEIEECSNISTDNCNLGEEEERCAGDTTLVNSPSTTLRLGEGLLPLQRDDNSDNIYLSNQDLSNNWKRKVSIKKETISLDRTPGESLGFDVCGTDSDGPVRVFVRKIKPGGLADRDGRLVERDEIAAINGESILDNEGGPEAFQQVMKKLEEQTETVTFTIKRKLMVEADPPALTPAIPEIELKWERAPNPLSLAGRKLIIEPDGSVLQPLSCDICNTGTGLGFGIVDDVYGNVRVNTILADSPAAKDCKLQLQDIVLEINEAMVRGLNQQHVARLLQCASPNVSLLIGRPVQLDLQRLELLASGLEGLTWRPLTLCENTGGIVVHSVENDNNSLLCNEDVIIQINDVSVEIVPEVQLPQLFEAARVVTVYRQHVVPVQEEEVPEAEISSEQEVTRSALRVVWLPEIQIVEFEKRNATLGISILPLIDPLKPSRTVIVIDHVQEESGLVDLVTPGSKLTSINDHVFNDCSFDIVAKVMKMTPSGPVRMGVTPLAQQPKLLSDGRDSVIQQLVITVSYNADFPGITLKPSPHSIIPGFEVCTILPGGLFHVDGRLKTGDIIVTLNYAETSQMSLKCIRAMVETSCKSSSLLRVSYVTHEDAQQEYNVVVARHPKTGIGITIAGGATIDNPASNIYIKKIVDINSPLKKGENIIKVNDISMIGLTHAEAVDVLKSATSPLTLTLQTPSGQGSINGSRENIEPENLLQLCLPRTREALGMKLGSCEQGLVVTHIEENSVADVIGLKPGDIIFKVNDTILRGVPQDMMMPLLRQQDGPTNVTVVRKPPRKSQVTPINSLPGTPVLEPKQDLMLQKQDHLAPVTVHHNMEPAPSYYSPEQSPANSAKLGGYGIHQNAFTVKIKKSGTTSLGINTVQRGDGIFVKNIFDNFPASQCDNIRPGDQILAVNEHRLTGLSRNKAIAILRKVEGDVTLLLTRPNMAVAQVNSSNSDKENAPSAGSPLPYVEVDHQGPLQNTAPPPSYPTDWDRSRDASVRSSEPDIAALKRTDNMTPDNISLRSYQSEKFSQHSPIHTLDQPLPSERLETSSPGHVTPSGSHVTPSGSLRSQTPSYGEVMNTSRLTNESWKQGDAVSLTDHSQRSSPVLRRQDTGERAPSGDRRISWHDSPIEVDTIPMKIANGDSGSGIILFSYPHSEGILVKSITNNSPAQQLVWPQDLIIRINENSTRDMALSDAAILLSEKKAHIEIEVKRDSPMYQLHDVILDKPKSGSLGLSITEKRSNPGIYISKVTPGGVAEKHGGVERGQRILNINGQNVKYMRQPDFIAILKSCGSMVELVVGTPTRDSDNRSTSSSQKQSPSAKQSPVPQRSSAGSARNSQPSSRGSPYSSQRSLHSSRGLMRQSPPPSPLAQHPQSTHSPHSSPRLSHRSYNRSPHSSPRGSFRSSNTPIGSPKEMRATGPDSQTGSAFGSQRELGSQQQQQVLMDNSHHSLQRDPVSYHNSQLENLSGSLRDMGSQRDLNSYQGSQRDLNYSNHGSQRDLNSYPNSQRDLSNASYHGSARDQYDMPRDHDYGSDRHSTPQGSTRDFPSHPGSKREFNMSPQHSLRDLAMEQSSFHGSYRDIGNSSPHGSQRDYGSTQHGSQKEFGSLPASQRDFSGRDSRERYREPDNQSRRSSEQSGRQMNRKPRHPSPSRSTHSTQSKRSNVTDRDQQRTDSLTHYSVTSLQSDYAPSYSVQSISTHSVQSFDSRPHDTRSNMSSNSYTKPKPPVLRTANLYREKNQPLGLSLGGGRGWPLGSIPLFISSLTKGGVAARAGVLKERDRIVSINGTNVEDFSHEDAVRLLKEATTPVTLVVTDPDTNRPDFKMVKLTRSQDGFGFSIVGGKDNVPSLPITIKQVFENGPAYGKLKRGDQIISVNGKSIEDYSREEATLLLKSCTETVTLFIQ
ncbi:multiple PDZ domain protein-like [Bolinopsis microptera]|uniref:multiple PDZ domain protein-like n=1 Tax=Bolinopsis microptera TaxID=2820187 RepID=UPI003079AE0E